MARRGTSVFVEGIFQSQDEIASHAFQNAGTAPGDLKFTDQLTVDTNGDGVPDAGDNVINAEDRVYLGRALPNFYYGSNFSASYKNFDLTLFFDSRLGNKIWDQTKWNLDFLGYVSNHGKNLLNAWTPTNTNTTIPILTNNNASFNKVNSSYYISDGSLLSRME